MRTIITNIKGLAGLHQKDVNQLKGKAMDDMPVLNNAWLSIADGKIERWGAMDQFPQEQYQQVIDAQQGWVLPAWCDSHTHLVYAGSREQEFEDRIHGLTYAEIAARGGGILNSAARLAQTSEQELYDSALKRLQKLVKQGTGAIEIKTGYGLDVANEMKMLRVIKRLQESQSVPVKATLLAAHAYPIAYKENQEAYIKYIIDEMIPAAVSEGGAEYIDVFCEQGFFSVDQSKRILEEGMKYGMKPKIHANQLHRSGGVQLGVELNAISVDHLESMGDEEIECLRNGQTIPTVLPGAAFFLAMHYQPARALIDADLPLCVASDYNPGSCPSGNMPLMLSLACTQMKMTPHEAINSATINGAAAMEMSEEYGSIVEGKFANLIITHPMSSLAYIPYDYGNNPVAKTLIKGVLQ